MLSIEKIAENVIAELRQRWTGDEASMQKVIMQRIESTIISNVEEYVSSLLKNEFRPPLNAAVTAAMVRWIENGEIALEMKPTNAAKVAVERAITRASSDRYEEAFDVRAVEMYVAYQNPGMTYDKVGKIFNLSGTRVRQILKTLHPSLTAILDKLILDAQRISA